jgi:hypothetical protein
LSRWQGKRSRRPSLTAVLKKAWRARGYMSTVEAHAGRIETDISLTRRAPAIWVRRYVRKKWR